MNADTGPGRKISAGLITLKKIVEGTSDQTGEKFFRLLVKNLAESLDVHGVWVTEYLRDKNRLRAIAFWLENHFVDEYEYDVPGTPCEPVLENEGICHVPDNVISLFPGDPDLPSLGAVSYMGVALRDEQGILMGHLALLDNKPMAEIPEAFAIFRIFASRAAAEMRRMYHEKVIIENEAKLSRLINGTREALIEINEHLIITQANHTALKTFMVDDKEFIGKQVSKFFDAESFRKIIGHITRAFNKNDMFPSSLITGNLTCLKSDGKIFPAEATISGYCFNNHNYHALFLRNIEDRRRTENELRKLTTESVMLREKVNAYNLNDIIGESPVMKAALKAIEQVAPMDSTVLIRGETGTGKELFAQAIHRASSRKNKAMITLNCAALPSELVESELFGHVKGAFTGASQTREGRFALADGSTIFLDEIGELPLNLQAKLLRVLQEGEFEPVGSSRSQKVNVRVIAATNRNLEEEIALGKFRQDLYYRLNVFPIYVPPLRERNNDIVILAEAFLNKFAMRSAVAIKPLDETSKQKLKTYDWPGNVRELQNVMERSIITSQNGIINLDTLLPSAAGMLKDKSLPEGKVLTEPEMVEIEKQNIIRALETANWKISGNDGAAKMLQVPPTTLSSRLSKLGITRSDPIRKGTSS
jgi:PAS domain S-box-containing protein